jgi:hypothetical protein
VSTVTAEDDNASTPPDPLSARRCLPYAPSSAGPGRIFLHDGPVQLPSQPGRFASSIMVGIERVPSVDANTPPWGTYMPFPLPPAIHDQLIDRFFTWLNPWCMWVERAEFISGLVDPNHLPGLRSDHYSPFLHLAILAVAHDQDADGSLSPASLGDTGALFAREAKKYMEIEYGEPFLSSVRGFALLALHHSVRCQESLGFLYFGMATRMAIDCQFIFLLPV